jgi:hypothetical protein
MASFENLAAALREFAKEVSRNSRGDLGGGGILSCQEDDLRRRRLQGLAAEAEAMAADPRTATYLGFDEILKQVQQLHGQPESETIIRVASAFVQRPHVSVTYRQGTFAPRPNSP